ncbi:MAG TPA: hypothetical protein VD789_09405 [Thermomicrobiales bacterium]|nr:hypothetical protein [Thermomicrobiales bacterium]
MEELTLDTTTVTQNGASHPPLPWTARDFRSFIDTTTGEIGRVVSSEKEPSGSHVFYFWADDNALTLDVGHIVVGFSEEAAVVAVVDEPRRYSDMQSFLDDYFDRHVELGLADIGATQRPEILVFQAKVLASRHYREDVVSKRPVINGPVYFATPRAIEFALGRENYSGWPIPALMHTNGNYERDENDEIVLDEEGRPRFQRTPIYLDEDYLLGPEAGHANWTGQSGLATKTSHSLFLISSAFQTLRKEGKKVAALMFNVKGPDLLWLDKPAQPAAEHAAAYREVHSPGLGKDDLDAYKALGLEPKAFENVRIFAPFRPGFEPPSRTGYVDLDGFGEYHRLNTERTAPGETDNVYPILWSLETALYYPHKVFSFGDLDDKLWGFIYELRERDIDSVDELDKLFKKIDQHFNDPDSGDYWEGHHKATIRKAQNRFKGLQDKLGGLLANGKVRSKAIPTADSPFVDQELRVIDISQANSTASELLVTSIINAVWKMAEKSELGVDKLIVFVDELNKYAPAGGDGGLRDTLVDIAARGRHLNVVLFGAQQFRSRVDGEILGNCGTSLYGRIGDEEIINAAYRSISETSKSELLGLPKGRLLIRHAHFREPLFGTFPMPPTIRGIDGQRVFGSEHSSVRGRPADALHTLLQSLMGDFAPSRADVNTECDGIVDEAIVEVTQKIRRDYSGGAHRGNAWMQTVKLLNRARYGAGKR